VSKFNVKPYDLRFLMPKSNDLNGQVTLAYKNMGFDRMASNTDSETGTPLVDLLKNIEPADIRAFLQGVLCQNIKTRDWLMHLFASDYQDVAETEVTNDFWRYLLYLPVGSEDELNYYLPEFNQKHSSLKFGSHIAFEKRKDFLLLRIKEATFENLYRETHAKVKLLLGSDLIKN